jgi:ABC-2 type transport system ATP-binding protein/ribosome-dependent ATPase
VTSTPVRTVEVTKAFGSFVAVDAVDLEVGAGEVVALLGANGAGKTTLIRMVLGLMTPSRGTVRLFGAPPSAEQRRRLGYVPQNLGLYTDLTVAENLEFRAGVFGVAPAPTVEADPRLVATLPVGLQRRAAFTAALQHEPELLVLDEPTSGVSPLARSRLWDLIRAAAEDGAAVLVSTHYMDEAVQADRLVVMARGRVVAHGTVDDVIGDRRTMVVRADDWADAFHALDGRDRPVLLSGRTLRVPLRPGDDPATVIAVLDDAGVGVETSVESATLDEVLVELSG